MVSDLWIAVPVQGITTLDAIVSRTTSEERFYTLATAAFAGIALTLALAGLLGLVTRAVTERRREIAIRIALGAGRGSLFKIVFAYGLTPVVLGLAAGLGIVVASARVLRQFLFEVTPTDPATYAAAAGLVILAALLGCYVPARRAMSVDPMTALKTE